MKLFYFIVHISTDSAFYNSNIKHVSKFCSYSNEVNLKCSFVLWASIKSTDDDKWNPASVQGNQNGHAAHSSHHVFSFFFLDERATADAILNQTRVSHPLTQAENRGDDIRLHISLKWCNKCLYIYNHLVYIWSL